MYSKAKYCTYLFEAQKGGGGLDSRQIEVILLFWRKFGLYSHLRGWKIIKIRSRSLTLGKLYSLQLLYFHYE